MTALAETLFALAILLGLWSYALYPALMARLASKSRLGGGAPEPSAGSVEVLVCAADEESVIGGRITDLLRQEYDGPYEIAVGCDGSSDCTAQIARGELGARGRVLEFPARRGKASVLNDLVASAKAEVLVLTDANTRFEPGAVSRLAQALRDPSVGAACGRLLIEGSESESAFWDRETRVKEAEGRLGVCLGANGAIYAARRIAVEPLPRKTTAMDDFLIPARIARRGLAVVFVGNAIARERATRSIRAEMGRRFRIGVGAGRVLREERWLWSPGRGWLWLAFVSRKAARWLMPVAALAGIAAACVSRDLWPLGAVAAAAVLLLLFLARADAAPVGAWGKLYYFGVINLSLAAGVAAGLFGYSRAAWKPAPREV